MKPLHAMTWQKISKGQVEVCFYDVFVEYRVRAEDQLKQAGLQAVKRTYDKKNGKIYITYKRQK